MKSSGFYGITNNSDLGFDGVRYAMNRHTWAMKNRGIPAKNRDFPLK